MRKIICPNQYPYESESDKISWGECISHSFVWQRSFKIIPLPPPSNDLNFVRRLLKCGQSDLTEPVAELTKLASLIHRVPSEELKGIKGTTVTVVLFGEWARSGALFQE